MVAWAYSKNGMVWNPSGKIIRDAYIPHGGWDLIKANISAKEFILHQEFHGNYSLLNVAVTLRVSTGATPETCEGMVGDWGVGSHWKFRSPVQRAYPRPGPA